MKEVWNRHDKLIETTPKRSIYWYLNKAKEEAMEFEVTDPTLTEEHREHFLEEGSDLIIVWMGAMKEAGFSYEVSLQAIIDKLDVVIDRADTTSVLTEMNERSWDENYQAVKAGLKTKH